MIEMSPEITKLAAALSKAQAELEGAKKDAKNPHFKSNYATLESVIEAVRPIHKHGLSYVQFPGGIVDGAIEISTILTHDSGQWMRSTLHVPLGKRDAQGVGSAISYGRRYALMAVLGVAAEDDDGNAASQPAPRRQDDDVQDWKVESRALSKLVNSCTGIGDLVELWKTARVQDFLKHAPPDLSNALTAIKDQRKMLLQQPAMEAAAE